MRIRAGRGFHPIAQPLTGLVMAGATILDSAAVFGGLNSFGTQVSVGERSRIGEIVDDFSMQEQEQRRKGEPGNPIGEKGATTTNASYRSTRREGVAARTVGQGTFGAG